MGSSGFENWTQAQVDAFNARIAAGRAKSGTITAVPDQALKTEVKHPTAITGKLECQESSDVTKLNKTERAFFNLLQAQRHPLIYVQAITLKLADDCRFTVDFIVMNAEGRLIGYETKGFFRDDAKVKLKVAARMFPFIKFILVTREKGEWKYEDVKP